jgi:hypothetical protein
MLHQTKIGLLEETLSTAMHKRKSPDEEQTVAAVYVDSVGDQSLSVVVCAFDSDISQLTLLRDAILQGVLDNELSDAMSSKEDGSPSLFGTDGVKVIFDKGHFAELYESKVKEMDKLTPHQDNIGADHMRRPIEGPPFHVHMRGPPGAGKTFVALDVMLSEIGKGRGLFCCANKSLAYFVASWMHDRLQAHHTLANAVRNDKTK